MRKLPKILAALVVVLALLYVGRKVWKRMPPYERGEYGTVVEAQSSGRGERNGPMIGSCPVFPADNVWNTPVDKLPKLGRGTNYIDSIGPMKPLHMDFGSNLDYGIPVSDVPAGTRGARVNFEYKEESDLGNYPIPADAPIEGGPRGHGDRHIILIDPRRCLLFELFSATPAGDGSWNAGSGTKWDLTGNALRTDTHGSADAAGLPILPGLIRYDEVTAGEIRHALRFTVPKTQNAYVWPARHKASRSNDESLPPLGVRFRLRADFDVSKYSKQNQVILTALKKYGMFLADNGAPMFISGVPDKRWDDYDLKKLAGVKAEDFEAVDEADLQLLPDSGRVDPLALPR